MSLIAFENRFELYLEIKSSIAKEIESLRRDKRIGKTLELKVIITCNPNLILLTKELQEVLGVSEVVILYDNSIEKFNTELITLTDDPHTVKCPRCWHCHGVTENFGHLPDEIEADPSLAKEKLCDNCQQTILSDYPNHPSVPHIKAAIATQREKYSVNKSSHIAGIPPAKTNT